MTRLNELERNRGRWNVDEELHVKLGPDHKGAVVSDSEYEARPFSPRPTSATTTTITRVKKFHAEKRIASSSMGLAFSATESSLKGKKRSLGTVVVNSNSAADVAQESASSSIGFASLPKRKSRRHCQSVLYCICKTPHDDSA